MGQAHIVFKKKHEGLKRNNLVPFLCQVNSTPCLSRDNSRNSNSGQVLSGVGEVMIKDKQQNSMVQTSFDSGYGMHSYMQQANKEGKREALIGEVYKKQGGAAPPQVTVINADSEPNNSMSAKPSSGGASNGGGSSFLGGSRPMISGAPSPRQLSRQGSSIESSAVHTHTVECAGGAHR